ncbi:MAG TPA: Mur ligase family protein [Solirubrobacterales bacterium]|jgi:UDP-N-acetylmuramoylalanine--D-glutamate ligase
MAADQRLLALRRRERPRVPDGPYLVVGLGQAGQSAARALAGASGAGQVLASDHKPDAVPKRVRRALRELGVRTRLGSPEGLLDLSPVPRTMVRSPGVPLEARHVQEAIGRGIEVIDEVELGWRLVSAPMVAVTGTNGKTTTATLAAAVLSRSGLDARLAGNADTAPALSAVPGDPELIVCELSSFQLEACPALLPEAAIFTNLSHDHLPRHGTMRRYGEVKQSLFLKDGEAVPLAVVDTTEEFGQGLARAVERGGGRAVRVGGPGSAYRIREARWDLRSAELVLDTPDGILELETRLPGHFNARNVAAVLALADSLGVGRREVTDVLTTHPGPEARFEHVDCGQAADVILDTGSSPAAVEHFLTAVQAGMDAGGRLRAVLGVLGGADPDQRREMGSIARRNCDELLLTAGSFRRNPSLQALEGLVAGAMAAPGAEMTIIPERAGAIAAAFRGSAEGDVIALLGRGNVVETIHGVKVDDRGVLYRLAGAHRAGGSGPEGADETAARELGVKLEQGGVGR